MTAASGTVFIAAGAFWLSFTSLADLARRSGVDAGLAWVWPLIVDGIIVVATVAVVALAGTRTAWYPWVLLAGGAVVSVTANALHAVVAADATVPGVLAASVAAVPPVVLLAITHLTVILTHADTPPRETEAGTSRVDVSEPVSVSAGTGVPPPGTPAADAQSFVPVAVEGGRLAADVSDGGVVAVGGDRRVRAVELREQGWSNKRIARQLRVHPSTVGRWFASTPFCTSPVTRKRRPDEHTRARA